MRASPAAPDHYGCRCASGLIYILNKRSLRSQGSDHARIDCHPERSDGSRRAALCLVHFATQ